MANHETRYPASDHISASEDSNSVARPMETPEQSSTHPKKTPKQHGIPEVARHTSSRGQDQERVSSADSESSGDEEAAMKQRSDSRDRDISGRSRKCSKWLIVGGRKGQNKPHEGDRDPHDGIRRNVQGPEDPHKTDAQVQETDEALIDSTTLDSKDRRECCFFAFVFVF